MEDVAAFEKPEIVSVDFTKTNLALPAFSLHFLNFFLILHTLLLQKLFKSQLVPTVFLFNDCLTLPLLNDVVRIHHCLLYV